MGIVLDRYSKGHKCASLPFSTSSVLDDLIDLIAEQLKDLAGLITRQQNLEKK